MAGRVEPQMVPASNDLQKIKGRRSATSTPMHHVRGKRDSVDSVDSGRFGAFALCQ